MGLNVDEVKFLRTKTLRNFSLEDANRLTGQVVRVKVRDMGLTRTVRGVLEPVTAEITKVGEDEILNECISEVW